MMDVFIYLSVLVSIYVCLHRQKQLITKVIHQVKVDVYALLRQYILAYCYAIYYLFNIIYNIIIYIYFNPTSKTVKIFYVTFFWHSGTPVWHSASPPFAHLTTIIFFQFSFVFLYAV